MNAAYISIIINTVSLENIWEYLGIYLTCETKVSIIIVICLNEKTMKMQQEIDPLHQDREKGHRLKAFRMMNL